MASYKLGVDVFCNVTCKTIEDSRVSARQMGPAVVALTEQNREQAKQTAQDLGARLGQLQSGLSSSDDDAPVPEKATVTSTRSEG